MYSLALHPVLDRLWINSDPEKYKVFTKDGEHAACDS